MGQKVNPIGLRLGINKTWSSRWYADPREYADLLHEDLKIRKMVQDLPECKNADIAEIEIVRHPQRVTIVIHTARLTDGTRKIVTIAEVLGVERDQVEMQDIFAFQAEGISPRGRVIGKFQASGNRPLCLDRLKAYGIHLSQSIFSEEHVIRER